MPWIIGVSLCLSWYKDSSILILALCLLTSYRASWFDFFSKLRTVNCILLSYDMHALIRDDVRERCVVLFLDSCGVSSLFISIELILRIRKRASLILCYRHYYY